MPLPNAKLKQATNFLSFIYWQGEFRLDIDAATSIIELLDRFRCTAALQKLDAYLASDAGALMPPSRPGVHSPSPCTYTA